MDSLPPELQRKRRFPRWLAGGLVLAVLLAGWFLQPGAQAMQRLAPWDPACPQLEAQWHVEPQEVAGELRHSSNWFLTSRGPILIHRVGQQPSGLRPPPKLQLMRLQDGAIDAQSDEVHRLQVCAATERDTSLWLLGSNDQPDEFQLHELELESLKSLQSTAYVHPTVVPKARLRPIDLVRFSDGALGVVYQYPDASGVRAWFVRFDPATREFGTPVVLAQMVNSISDVYVLADDSLGAGVPRIIPALLRFDPATGGSLPTAPIPPLVIDPLDPLSRKLSNGTAISTDVLDTSICESPALSLHPILTHPAARLLDIGNVAPVSPLAAAKTLVRAEFEQMSAHQVVQEEGKVPAVFLATAGAVDAHQLLADTSYSVRQTLRATFTSGLQLFALDGKSALLTQVVCPSPKSINDGRGVLRLGTIDGSTSALTWHGWLPLPLDPDSLFLFDVSIIPVGNEWTLFIHASGPNRGPMLGAPYCWTTIPNPVGVRTTSQRPLSCFPGPLQESIPDSQ